MAPVFCKDCSNKISGFFKKKFTCQLCLNRFCDKCFSKVKDNAAELSDNRSQMSGQNCLPCIVLQSGKLKREELFLLRPKQLAVYLNERNISTENCSEKYHLVDLIMEFAESHGIKSGDDMENDVMHRDHVEELKRKAELLRVAEHVSENDSEQSESEQSVSEQSVSEQPHFSGGVNYEATASNDSNIATALDTEPAPNRTSGVDTEPSPNRTSAVNRESAPNRTSAVDMESVDADTLPAYSNRSENEDLNSGAGHQENPENHVPPSNPESGSNNPQLSPRHQASGEWYSVEDIQMEEDISSLSVLELKQILAANFIDYRGCCEKNELINKVTMLYQSQQTEQPDGDKGDRDLCKICMDRIIDCVFLDCAHLVACTKCGKKLSECPICRAFIVRVVHIFRA